MKMELRDYIYEAISSGKHRYARNIDRIDKNISLGDFTDMLNELGYINEESEPKIKELSLFEKGLDRYRLIKMPSGIVRVCVKNSEKATDVYMRVLFKRDKFEAATFVFLDGSGDVDSEPTDLEALTKYINHSE